MVCFVYDGLFVFVLDYSFSSRRLLWVMSFDCKSNALVVSYFLFLSALSSTLTMLRLALFDVSGKVIYVLVCPCNRDDGRCVRTSLQWFQLGIVFLAYC